MDERSRWIEGETGRVGVKGEGKGKKIEWTRESGQEVGVGAGESGLELGVGQRG